MLNQNDTDDYADLELFSIFFKHHCRTKCSSAKYIEIPDAPSGEILKGQWDIRAQKNFATENGISFDHVVQVADAKKRPCIKILEIMKAQEFVLPARRVVNEQITRYRLSNV
tara:strand:+ start:9346 stop:9681 length:336 start_codon:yes stop_codon:yes gene_type:complete